MKRKMVFPFLILTSLLLGCSNLVYKVQVRDKDTNNVISSIPTQIDLGDATYNKSTGADGIAIFSIENQYNNKYGTLSIDGITGYKPYVKSVQLREDMDIVLLEPIGTIPTPTDTSTPTPTDTSTPTPTATPSCKILEDFDPKEEVNMWSPDPDVFDFLRTTASSVSPPNSYQISYKLTDTYQFVAADLGPLPEEMRFFGEYQTLQVWILGDAPILLNLELSNEISLDVTTEQSNNPQEWSLLSFDISQITALDEVQVNQLKFYIAPGNESADGIILFDDIRLCE